MRSLWLTLGLCLCASAAQAQVEQGSFKLSLDTEAFAYTALVVEDSDADAKSTDRRYAFGPGGAALDTGLPGYVALAFGYVAHPHLIPQLHLAFTRTSGEEEYEDEDGSDDFELPTTTTLMLRPELEIPFNPEGRVVGYGLVGLDYRHIGVSEEDEGFEVETSVNGIGPVLGFGLHFFVGSGASIDLGAQFSYLTFNSEVEVDGESEEVDADMRVTSFSINAGLSLWP